MVKKPPVGSSDEWSSKRPSEDAISTVSSLHSSPTVSPQGSPRKGLQPNRFTFFCLLHFVLWRIFISCILYLTNCNIIGGALHFSLIAEHFLITDTYCFISSFISTLIVIVSVGGATKSQNSSQMNLSGSSSSLTSDASTKTGVSLRSYGIGGALLHKRILLMTSQHSRDSSRERDAELEEVTEEIDAAQRGLCSSEQRGRSRQQRKRGAQADAEPVSLWTPALKCMEDHRSPLCHPEAGLVTPLPPQSYFTRPKPLVSPIRARLMSPFRVLRERSQSREKPLQKNVQSEPQNGTQGQTEQRARRSVSPNPFLWLCRDRHARRKTVWDTEPVEKTQMFCVFISDGVSFRRRKSKCCVSAGASGLRWSTERRRLRVCIQCLKETMTLRDKTVHLRQMSDRFRLTSELPRRVIVCMLLRFCKRGKTCQSRCSVHVDVLTTNKEKYKTRPWRFVTDTCSLSLWVPLSLCSYIKSKVCL